MDEALHVVDTHGNSHYVRWAAVADVWFTDPAGQSLTAYVVTFAGEGAQSAAARRTSASHLAGRAAVLQRFGGETVPGGGGTAPPHPIPDPPPFRTGGR